MRHGVIYPCPATPVVFEDGWMCMKYFFAHPPSPSSTYNLVSSLLSPPSLSPTITYSIFWNLHVFTQFGSSPTPTNKVSVPTHPIRSSPPSTRLFVTRVRSVFFCPPLGRGRKETPKPRSREKKKSKHQEGSHCQTIASLLSLSVQDNYRSFPSVLRQIQKVRILNQTRSSHPPQLLLRDRD